MPSAATAKYLSVRELAELIPYAEGTIRNLMVKGVFVQGIHYIKPRGRIMFVWSAVEAWLQKQR